MNAMTWNDLPLIDDALALDESDSRCLDEIREVLERNGKEKRFGVSLLHHHFQLSDDEVLVEHCDIKKRTLVTAPLKASAISDRYFRPTVWRFDGHQAHICAYCAVTEDSEGRQRHAGYKDTH